MPRRAHRRHREAVAVGVAVVAEDGDRDCHILVRDGSVVHGDGGMSCGHRERVYESVVAQQQMAAAEGHVHVRAGVLVLERITETPFRLSGRQVDGICGGSTVTIAVAFHEHVGAGQDDFGREALRRPPSLDERAVRFFQ